MSFLPKPQHPRQQGSRFYLRWRLGWLKGWAIRPLWKMQEYFLFGPKITVGKRFSLCGKMKLRGPGKITIGDDCVVEDYFTPFTHWHEAEIIIGNRVYLNGPRLGCAKRISIGDDCILADARIMDTDFHSVHALRNTLQSPPPLTAPVTIENNVWIAAGAAILKGVSIGRDSMIGFGAVVPKSVPAGRIYAGNPAIEVGSVPKD